jgi:hypothetical protein
MRTSLPALIALAALTLAPLAARSAGDEPGALQTGAFPGLASPAADAGQDAPAQPPPAPPEETPPPPQPAPQAAADSRIPAGQWVYTQQYGWIWMPYGDAYTYSPTDGYGQPYMYVYYPAAGWTWVVAPWVWGGGPWPYFGAYGPAYFAWYQWGWWRYPYYSHFGPGFRTFPYAVNRPFVAPVRPPGARPGTGVRGGAIAPAPGFTGRGGSAGAPAPSGGSRGGGGGGASRGNVRR